MAVEPKRGNMLSSPLWETETPTVVDEDFKDNADGANGAGFDLRTHRTRVRSGTSTTQEPGPVASSELCVRWLGRLGSQIKYALDCASHASPEIETREKGSGLGCKLAADSHPSAVC
ncbi:hypothetical protein CMUS01_13133 [Colletotrichum musicola]|uniref:Uncharacterized protein n=1 Tax=Colletotrichum musicola TaxID=2175873 RepID=A0A8H6JFE5_9PEZI|nr:hypothetical protein CMUS01_13133 [Colletotrichum musicola]